MEIVLRCLDKQKKCDGWAEANPNQKMAQNPYRQKDNIPYTLGFLVGFS